MGFAMALQNCFEYTELVQPDAFRIIILLQPSTVLDSPIQCTLIATTLLKYDNDIVDHYLTSGVMRRTNEPSS
jgi:hypothetical protein